MVRRGSGAAEAGALAAGHEHDGNLVEGDQVKALGVPMSLLVGARVQETGTGSLGQGLEGGGTIVGRRREGLGGDGVDVFGVERGELVVESSLLLARERVVEGKDLALASGLVLGLKLGDLLRGGLVESHGGRGRRTGVGSGRELGTVCRK